MPFRVLVEEQPGEWTIVRQDVLFRHDGEQFAKTQFGVHGLTWRVEEYGPGIPDTPGKKRYSLILDPATMKTTFT